MLPISGSVLGGALSLAARIARGEIEVDESARERVQKLRWRVEETSRMVGDLSLDEPATWGRAAGRFADHVFDTHGMADSSREWREGRGFTVSVGVGEEVGRRICESSAVRARAVFESGDEAVLAVELPGGAVVTVEVGRGSGGGIDGVYRADASDEGRVEAGLRRACWADARALRFERDGIEWAFRAVDLPDDPYRGKHAGLLETWRAYLEAGQARAVLLQGPPGAGKTTLCMHTARELAERSLVLTGDSLRRLSTEGWRRVVSLLAPDLVVIDDVDRTEGAAFEGAEHLQLFGELREEVPLLLMTSNDHTALPAALRRPGRIDRIVEFEPPSAEVRRETVRSLADEQGVELNERRVGQLVEILATYSVAHVEEALRRASVLGWEAVGDGDEMFRMQREYADVDEWLDTGGFERVTPAAPDIFEVAFDRGDCDVRYRGERRCVEAVELSGDVEIARVPERTGGRSPTFYTRTPDSAGDDEVALALRRRFWRGRRAAMAATGNDGSRFRTVELGEWEYFGPRRQLIDRWRRYMREGVRRCVLLTGPPGTGKSTLCLHAARELAERTLVFTSGSFGSVRADHWRATVDRLTPDVLIVDDVDRAARSGLTTKLRLLEDRHCDVPLLLFTCNDPDRLPDPMRRPGRIDQTLEFETLDLHRCERVVRELADREGVEIPEEYLGLAAQVFREHSPAHVRELLRRAKVVGWEHIFSAPGDETFEVEASSASRQSTEVESAAE